MQTNTDRRAYYDDAPLVLVVGCGDMGMGCARALGRRQPLMLVDIDEVRLDQCVSVLSAEGYHVTGWQCDITDSAAVNSLGEMLSKGPGIRILAHVAAVAGTTIGWRKIMDVDLIGAHRVAAAVGPSIVRGGVAILISSTGSYQCPASSDIDQLLDDPFQDQFQEKIVEVCGGEPDFLEAYFLAKQGVNRLARKLALEWGPREVRAVSVSPGLINTTMGRTSGGELPVYDENKKDKQGSRQEKAAREVPLGRQGTVLEITSVVEFLASDGASFINGIDIPVDGGSTALRRDRGLIER